MARHRVRKLQPVSAVARRGPPTGSRKAAEYQSLATLVQSHPFVDMTVEDLVSILFIAEQGRMAPQQDLFDDLLDRDLHLNAVYSQRKHTIASREFRYKTPKGLESDPEAQRNVAMCEMLTDEIEDRDVAVLTMFEGIGRGYSIQEKDWETNNLGWWVPKRFSVIHPNRIAFDARMVPRRFDVGVDPWPGASLDELKGGPHGFLWHSPPVHSMYPTRRGLMRPATWMVMVKRYGLRWWTIGLERFGLPGIWAQLPEGAEHLRDKALEFMTKLAADWIATATEGFDVNLIEGTGKFDGAAHDRLARFVDEQLSKQFLGQTLTTDAPRQGGSRAQGEVQDRTRGDLERWDGKLGAASWRRDVVAPMVLFNRPGTPVPEVEFVVPEEKTQVPAHYFGVPVVRRNEARASIGLPPVDGPEGDEYVTTAVDAGVPGAPPPTPPGGVPPAGQPPPEIPPSPRATSPLARPATTTPSSSSPTSTLSRRGLGGILSDASVDLG